MERNRAELARKMACSLANVRLAAGLSQEYIAMCMGRNPKTIRSWEQGTSAPSAVEFVIWHDICGKALLREALNLMYPADFEHLPSDAPTDDVRKALVTYWADVAPDDEVRKMAYLIFGDPRSTWRAQLEMMVADAHLPMLYRIPTAQNVVEYYTILAAQGLLVGDGHIMPDIEHFQHAINDAREAVLNGKDGYTTAYESE